MAAPLLELDDHAQVHALLRAIVEAKFHPQPQDPLIWGSPLVAAVAMRVFEATVQSDERLGKHQNAQASREWQRSLMSNALLPVVRSRLRQDAKEEFWRKLSPSERQGYVAQCITPFTADANVLAQLVNEAEA
jgi:hypothetical protein